MLKSQRKLSLLHNQVLKIRARTHPAASAKRSSSPGYRPGTKNWCISSAPPIPTINSPSKGSGILVNAIEANTVNAP